MSQQILASVCPYHVQTYHFSNTNWHPYLPTSKFWIVVGNEVICYINTIYPLVASSHAGNSPGIPQEQGTVPASCWGTVPQKNSPGMYKMTQFYTRLNKTAQRALFNGLHERSH